MSSVEKHFEYNNIILNMKEFQRKKKKLSLIYSIPSLVFLSIITFFLVKGTIRVMEKEFVSRARSKDLEEKAATLTLREEEIKGNLARLRTEEGIKDEIRERFNVTQEGEHVAVLVDRRAVSTTTDNSEIPWYKRVWFAIIGGK